MCAGYCLVGNRDPCKVSLGRTTHNGVPKGRVDRRQVARGLTAVSRRPRTLCVRSPKDGGSFYINRRPWPYRPAAVVRFPDGTWASTTEGRGRRGPAPPGLLEHRKPECAGRSPSCTEERVSILAASDEGEQSEAERRFTRWNSSSSSLSSSSFSAVGSASTVDKGC